MNRPVKQKRERIKAEVESPGGKSMAELVPPPPNSVLRVPPPSAVKGQSHE